MVLSFRFRSVCRKSPCTHGRAITFWVKAIGPSNVSAIPAVASQSRGNVLLRLEGVEVRLRNLARVLVVVRVEQL